MSSKTLPILNSRTEFQVPPPLPRPTITVFTHLFQFNKPEFELSIIVSWEPEGRYRHWLCTAIEPFWFSTEHLWVAVTPFWLSSDDISSRFVIVIVNVLLKISWALFVARQSWIGLDIGPAWWLLRDRSSTRGRLTVIVMLKPHTLDICRHISATDCDTEMQFVTHSEVKFVCVRIPRFRTWVRHRTSSVE